MDKGYFLNQIQRLMGLNGGMDIKLMALLTDSPSSLKRMTTNSKTTTAAAPARLRHRRR